MFFQGSKENFAIQTKSTFSSKKCRCCLIQWGENHSTLMISGRTPVLLGRTIFCSIFQSPGALMPGEKKGTNLLSSQIDQSKYQSMKMHFGAQWCKMNINQVACNPFQLVPFPPSDRHPVPLQSALQNARRVLITGGTHQGAAVASPSLETRRLFSPL